MATIFSFQNCAGGFMGSQAIGKFTGSNRKTMDAPITFGNSTLQLTATPRLAGSIEFLTFNGKQFLDNYDHGRELETAFWNNNLGECENPTQAGSQDDATGGRSTSVLLSSSATADSFTSTVWPAFFMQNGEVCDDKGTKASLSTTTASDQPLTTSVTVGVDGDEHIIHYVATIANQYPHPSMNVSFGAAMTSDFSNSYVYIPSTGKLEPLTVNVMTWEPYPVVVATPDGNYAYGIVGGDRNNAFVSYSVSQNGVAGAGVSLSYGATPAGNLTQDGYMVVGTLADVSARMGHLVALVHTSLDPTTFDRAFYVQSQQVNLTSDPSAILALEGWQANGTMNSIRASTVFDPAMIATYNPAIASRGPRAQLWDFIHVSQATGQRASLEFDPAFYLANNPDVATMVSNDPKAASEHWVMTGIDEGRAGSADFSPADYLNRYPDLQKALGTKAYRKALYNWILKGRAAGRIGTAATATPTATATTNSYAGSASGLSAGGDGSSAAAQTSATTPAVNQAQSEAQAHAADAAAFAARQTQSVYRYMGPAGHIFALKVDGSGLPMGSSLEGAVFNVYLVQYANTVGLFRCQTSGHQFLSTDSGCEGQTVKGLLGFISTNQAGRTKQLLRMHNSESGDYIEDMSSSPYTGMGYTVDGPLGYVP